ncbi:MAG: NfeD family protein [Spirochaetaceae bacterium]
MRRNTWVNPVRSLLLLSVAVVLLTTAVAAEEPDSSTDGSTGIMVLDIDGTISAGTAQFLRESVEEAVERGHDAVLIRLDTPGGLVDATLDIIKDLLAAPIPLITYVHPQGGIAASAGTFILITGHVAAMSPGTTAGAAMPVTMQPGENGQRAADEKTISFLAGHMTNIAEARGRPPELARQFVTENLTLGATEALEEGVIDIVAADTERLLAELDGRTVVVNEREVTLSTDGAELIETELTARQQIMDFVSNPQVAFLLFMLGVYGIFFGLNMPGTFVPETLGVIALVLALFGLGMFEVNALGIVLLVAAVLLFVLEAFTPTFGFFTAAGVVALVMGALLMPVEPMMPTNWFQTFIVTVLGMAAVSAAFFVLVITKIIASSRIPAVHAEYGMSGYEGLAVEELAPAGMVKIRGERWTARSYSGTPIPEGTPVRVRGRQGMELLVEPTGGHDNEGGV